MLAYSSARRISSAVATGRPSSVNATQPAALQLGDVGQLLALLAARHGADRIDTGKVCVGRLLQHVLRDAGVVVHGRGVRHAGHRGESAGDGGRRPGGHRLLVLLTGLAQMHVDIDQPGTDHQSARHVDHRRAGLNRQVAPDACDPAVGNEHVEHAVAPVRGIDDAPALQQLLHVHLS